MGASFAKLFETIFWSTFLIIGFWTLLWRFSSPLEFVLFFVFFFLSYGNVSIRKMTMYWSCIPFNVKKTLKSLLFIIVSVVVYPSTSIASHFLDINQLSYLRCNYPESWNTFSCLAILFLDPSDLVSYLSLFMLPSFPLLIPRVRDYFEWYCINITSLNWLSHSLPWPLIFFNFPIWTTSLCLNSVN